MKDEIKEILEELKEKNKTYKECSENGIVENEYYKSHILLDYITNLQEENYRLKDYFNIMVLGQNNMSNRYWDLQQRNEKAIDNIDLVIELIKQQPTEDDAWILNRLNGFKYILQGSDKE